MNTSLTAYLDMIPERPLLSREEEADLLRQAQAGRALGTGSAAQPFSDEEGVRTGKAAEAVLAESFLYKIIQLARSMHERNGGRTAVEDLVSAGNEGLVKAIGRFDLSKGTRFWTYASWWVRDAMSRELRFWRWPLQISDGAYRSAIKFMGASEMVWQETGESPTNEALADALGWDVERVQATLYQLSLNDVLSIERPMGESGKTTFADFLVDEKGMYGADPTLVDAAPDTVGSAASLLALKDAVRDCVGALSTREQEVLDFRFGLSDGRVRTLSRVGEKMGISGERARQLQESAIKHLSEGPLAERLERLLA